VAFNKKESYLVENVSEQSEQKNRYRNPHLPHYKDMAAAVNCVQKEGKGLREVARLFNLPVESLKTRVIGSVELIVGLGLPLS